MRHRFRTRSRLVVAAALSLAGVVPAIWSAPPAQAACLRASVWIYENKQGPEYVWGPEECVVGDATWAPVYHDWAGDGANHELLPPGTPTGGGVEVWITLPPV